VYIHVQYEYGPFGEVIRATGSARGINPFRFSSKCQDDETDRLYYGYRYYAPDTGRWLSLDPIDEPGFRSVSFKGFGDVDLPSDPNLFGFVRNFPPGELDCLGLITVGFYGADTPFSFPNDGNKSMKKIADAVGAPL
jgi:RHS repeat-associated protein